MSRRAGFTLVETLIVVVVIGLVSLIAMPKFQHALAHSNVLSAKAKVVSLYARARASAIESGRTAAVRANGNSLVVTASPRRLPGAGTIDTVVAPTNIRTQYGVGLSGLDSVRVGPTGIGLGAAQIVLTKSSYADTVFINQFGRVRK